jgi:hypothetical protein
MKRFMNYEDVRSVKNDNSNNGFSEDRHFIFGAPNYEARKFLQDAPFIFAGHSDNEISFYSRPIVDSDLTRETYGKINLDYFFINILKGAEELINIFANYKPEDLALDKKIWSYNAERMKR